MVKTKFKKAVSLVLAAVMSLTAFMGIGATTAFAAVGEKADVYLVDYPRSGDTNNNGEWGHGNLNYMNGWKGLSTKYTGLRAMGSYSGNIAYCIEPGTGQRTGDTLTEKCWSQARLAIFRPVELTNFRTYKNSQCTFSFRFTYYLLVIIHQLLLLQFHICFHDSCFL